MFLESFHSNDSLLANGTLVKAASVFVKPFMLTKVTRRLELCVTRDALEQLRDERMRVGDVTRHVIFPLERRRTKGADVTSRFV